MKTWSESLERDSETPDASQIGVQPDFQEHRGAVHSDVESEGSDRG